MSMELVSDFAELVATLPDELDRTGCDDAPPILSCGDKSIADTAITILQVREMCIMCDDCK